MRTEENRGIISSAKPSAVGRTFDASESSQPVSLLLRGMSVNVALGSVEPSGSLRLLTVRVIVSFV